jgi:diguanylate cyclase (GGDEF)-like protein
MKRRPIPFHDLLERVLPLGKLPALEQERIASVLRAGNPSVVEATAMETLARLVDLGCIRLVADVDQGTERLRRYQNLATGDTIALVLPKHHADAALIQRIPLPMRDWEGATTLDQVRTLFNLYNKILTRDSQMLRGDPDILRQVMLTARQMVACERISFWSGLTGDPNALPLEGLHGEAYDETEARDWVLGRRFLVVLPDLPAQIDPGRGTLDREFRSLAMIPVGEPGLGIHGVLHAWSTEPHHFGEERQALLSLLSEFATELLRRSQILGNLVFVDAATQVYNRAYFNLQLENEIARAKREGKSLALAIADIDDFKAFNNTYGYEGGNQVLAHAAQILKRGLRPFDSVARWGGEEFALILTAPVSAEDARVVCERLRHATELSSFTITGLEGESKSVHLTVTLGGAVYPDGAAGAGDLWRAANAALVYGKRTGKNRVIFASELPEDALGAHRSP